MPASAAPCTSTPASSPGPAATSTPSSTGRSAPTTRCARRRWRCAARGPAAHGRARPTAPIPGLVSHFVKQALLEHRGRHRALRAARPPTREGWARLAQRLGVTGDPRRRARHAGGPRRARRRTSSSTPGRWTASSARAASRPSWAGARHERHFPADGRAPRARLRGAAIYLDAARARHARAHLDAAGGPDPRLPHHPRRVDLDRRLPDARRRRQRRDYRPTVHYAYHPCDDAVLSLHELAGRNWRLQPARSACSRTTSSTASTSWACC
ncbi:MAG: hypothetical protein MZW92_76875 [Comamonadaceae bacterium]|nr:hypothetical protein [Comamonadaceae bacterium]